MTFDMQTVDAEVRQANNALAVAQSYVIDSTEMAEAAAEDLRDIVTRKKKLTEVRMSMTRPLDESKKRIMELFEPPATALESAENLLKNGLSVWQQHCRKIEEAERAEREKETRRLADEARAATVAAEAEAAEVAKAAEAAAAAVKAAEASGDAEAIAAANSAAAAAEAAVVAAEDEANATAMIADSIEYMAPVVAEKSTLKGVSSRDSYKAEVVDLMALVKAVAAGEASIALLEANTKVINKQVAALKTEFKVPGIRVYTQAVVSARAR